MRARPTSVTLQTTSSPLVSPVVRMRVAGLRHCWVLVGMSSWLSAATVLTGLPRVTLSSTGSAIFSTRRSALDSAAVLLILAELLRQLVYTHLNLHRPLSILLGGPSILGMLDFLNAS